jgi:Protein of unknown function (DUF3185)
MTVQRSFGIFLLVGGIILLIIGVNASSSAADQISNTFLGRFTQSTIFYSVLGGGAALFGLLVVLGDGRGNDA